MRRVASEFIGDRIAAWVHVPTYARPSLRSLVGEKLGQEAKRVFQEGDRVCTQCMKNCDADAVVYAREETHDKFAAPGACMSCGLQCARRWSGYCRPCEDMVWQARLRAKLGESHRCPHCAKSLGEQKRWRPDGTCNPCYERRRRQRIRAKLGESHRCPDCGIGQPELAAWRPNGTCNSCYNKKHNKKYK